jgi:hypothetical protein
MIVILALFEERMVWVLGDESAWLYPFMVMPVRFVIMGYPPTGVIMRCGGDPEMAKLIVSPLLRFVMAVIRFVIPGLKLVLSVVLTVITAA